MTFLDYALAYARRGWPVFPLMPRSKEPAIKRGLLDASTDEDIIRAWWSTNPNLNVGIRTGGDWFVLDIDSGKHPEAAEWFESVTLPDTITAVTGTGGRHMIFRMPDFEVRNSTSKVGPHIDIRGEGGYIVAAPSIHPDTGKSYFWDDPDGIPAGEPAEAPEWLIEKLRESKPSQQFELPATIKTGERHDYLFKYCCSLRSRDSMGEHEILGAALMVAKRCEEVPPDEDVREIVRDVCKRYAPGVSEQFKRKDPKPTIIELPPLPPPKPPIDVDLLLQSDDPLVLLGMARELAELDESEFQIIKARAKQRYGTKFSGANLEKAVVAERKKRAAASQDDDDDVPAHVIAQRILDQYSFLTVGGNLYYYENNHWTLAAKHFLRNLALAFDGDENSTKVRRTEIEDFITDKSFVGNITWRQIKESEIPMANGVLDLQTMKVRPHRKEDYLQTCIPWDLDPQAQCPTLMACLDTYFGGDDDEEEKKAALQEFFGYCLMPHAKYKKALFCLGESDCGKSTIPFLLRTLLGGNNVAGVSVDQMDDPRKRAPLYGKLVNLLTELTYDAMIADGGFKNLVSIEEPILFDPKYAQPVLDVPICKHVFATNSLPRINDRSNATFNRILLINFLHVIPASQQDRGIWEKLRNEIQGILLWAIEGAKRLYERGGTFTTVGKKEVDDYKSDQDPLQGFIADFYDIDPEGRTPMPDFTDMFRKHVNNRASPQVVAHMIRAAGFTISKNPVFFPGGRRTRAVEGISPRQLGA